MSNDRVFNFGAGPAVLPESVLEEAQRDLRALPGVGMSVLEISHRSRTFEEIIGTTAANIRALTGVPDAYHVLFLQGGATQQFSMVPLNLLPPDGAADYVLTGAWSKKAADEAERFGTVRVAGSTERDSFTRVPGPHELDLGSDAAYVHLTSNNTIWGTQWGRLPHVGSVPLVVDSSSIFSAARSTSQVMVWCTPALRRTSVRPASPWSSYATNSCGGGLPGVPCRR